MDEGHKRLLSGLFSVKSSLLRITDAVAGPEFRQQVIEVADRYEQVAEHEWEETQKLSELRTTTLSVHKELAGRLVKAGRPAPAPPKFHPAYWFRMKIRMPVLTELAQLAAQVPEDHEQARKTIKQAAVQLRLQRAIGTSLGVVIEQLERDIMQMRQLLDD